MLRHRVQPSTPEDTQVVSIPPALSLKPYLAFLIILLSLYNMSRDLLDMNGKRTYRGSLPSDCDGW